MKLVIGNDEFLKSREAIARVKIESLADATPSLFGEIKPSVFYGDIDWQWRGNADVILIPSHSVDQRKKEVKAFIKENSVEVVKYEEIPSYKEKEIHAFIEKEAKSLGLELSKVAIAELNKVCQTSYERCNALKMLHDLGYIKVGSDAITECFGKEKFSIDAFCQAISKKQSTRLMELLDGEIVPAMLISLLVKKYGSLSTLAIIRGNDDELAKSLGKSSGQIYYLKKELSELGSRVNRILNKCLEIDSLLKQGMLSDAEFRISILQLTKI